MFVQKIKMQFGFLLAMLLLGLPFANSASAEEQLIADQQVRFWRGDQQIDLANYLLNAGRNSGRINSVVVMASTERGAGTLEVIADGQILSSQQVGTRLESIQVRVDRSLNFNLRSLVLHTKGNFTIALVGITLENGFGGGQPMPPAPQPPRPPHQPMPPQQPGFPHQPPVPPQAPSVIVGQQDVDALIREMKYESFDDRRITVVQQYVRYWAAQGRRLTMDHATQVLSVFTFDQKRLESLQSIRPMLIVELYKIEQVLNTFTFANNRRQARDILMSN